MIALIRLLFEMLGSPLKSRSRLEGETAVLQQQLIVLRRKAKCRAQLNNGDRWFFVQLYRLFPSVLDFFSIIRPEARRAGRIDFREGQVLHLASELLDGCTRSISCNCLAY